MSEKPKSIKEVIQGQHLGTVEGQEDGQPSNRQRHDDMVEALLKGRFDIIYTAETAHLVPKATFGFCHRAAKWWLGVDADPDDMPPEGATPETVVGFYRWFVRQHPDASKPDSHEAIVRQWAAFAADKSGLARARHVSMAMPTNNPAIVKQYPEERSASQMTQEEIDDYYRQWAEKRPAYEQALEEHPRLAEVRRYKRPGSIEDNGNE